MIDLVTIVKDQNGPTKIKFTVFLGIIYTYTHKQKKHTSYAQTDFEHALWNHFVVYSLGYALRDPLLWTFVRTQIPATHSPLATILVYI